MIKKSDTIKSVSFGQVEDINLRIDPKNFIHIFNMLSNSLYSDKMAAVIREIICNARDANLNSGRPIQIHTPNKLNNSFSVTDFGEGLSYQQIVDIFASIGQSTKQNSNDGVGFFGIGSKSPFAYTDSFLIESVVDGYLSVYNNLKTESGPKIQMMGQPIKTDRHSGVTVIVKIRYEDISFFNIKLQYFLYFFDQDYVLNGIFKEHNKTFGNVLLDLPDINTQILSLNHASKSISSVLMGGVIYEVDLRKLGFQNSKSDLILKVPIGALDVPPSRETIEYNDNNKRYISDILKRIADFYNEKMNQLKFDDYTEIKKNYQEYAAYCDSLSIPVAKIASPFSITTTEDTIVSINGTNTIKQTAKITNLDVEQYLRWAENHRLEMYFFAWKRNKRGLAYDKSYIGFDDVTTQHKLFYVDTESNLDKRLSHFFSTNNNSCIVLLRKENLEFCDTYKVKILPELLNNISSLPIQEGLEKRKIVRKKYYYYDKNKEKVSLNPVDNQIQDGDVIFVKVAQGKSCARSEDLRFINIHNKTEHFVLCKDRYVINLKNDFPENTIVFIHEVIAKLDNLVSQHNITATQFMGFIFHYGKLSPTDKSSLRLSMAHVPRVKNELREMSRIKSKSLKVESHFNPNELKVLRYNYGNKNCEKINLALPCRLGSNFLANFVSYNVLDNCRNRKQEKLILNLISEYKK